MFFNLNRKGKKKVYRIRYIDDRKLKSHRRCCCRRRRRRLITADVNIKKGWSIFTLFCNRKKNKSIWFCKAVVSIRSSLSYSYYNTLLPVFSAENNYHNSLSHSINSWLIVTRGSYSNSKYVPIFLFLWIGRNVRSRRRRARTAKRVSR